MSGSFDETVRLWDLRRGTCHRAIAAHSEAVTGVDFSRDGAIIASCSYDGLIRFWDTSTGQCLKTLVHSDKAPVSSCRFSPNAAQLLASSLDGHLRLWDVANSRVLKTYAGHHNEKYAIKAAFTAPYHRRRRQASEEGENAQTNGRKQEQSISVITGSEDQRVYLWDLQTKQVVETLQGHHDVVIAVASHPTLPILASASLEHDPCIKVGLKSTRAVLAS